MRKWDFLILTFMMVLSGRGAFSQITEIECIISKRSGSNLTLKPAQYDEAVLPKPGDQVLLSIYLKDDLPAGKSEGFYELFMISTIKLIPNLKGILFDNKGDLEAARILYGIDNISLNAYERVKISWTSLH